MTVRIRIATLSFVLFFAAAAPALSQTTYTWDGSQNNNWDNGTNWSPSGWPDDPDDDVVFDDTADRFDVDLRGGDRDVGDMTFPITFAAGTIYRFESNTGGDGILRINGNLTRTGPGSVTFTNELDVFQVGNSTWNSGIGNIIVNGNLRGSGNINLQNGATFNASNPYSGIITLQSGVITIGHVNAFANATVAINTDDGLNINGLSANLGALAGSGDLDLGSKTLITGGNGASTTHSGILTGDVGSILRHNGPGTLNIAGRISGLGTLANSGAGTLTLTGGDAIAPSSIGTLRGQNGAIVVNGARIDPTSTSLSSDDGPLLAVGGDITLQPADVRFSAGAAFANNGTITVSGSMSSLQGPTVNAAELTGTTGSIVVQDSASLNLSSGLIIGNKGHGDLTVESGATAGVGVVRLGLDASGIGDALVTGANSTLSANGVDIGGGGATPGGTGTLIVENDGAVQISGLTQFLTTASSITVNGGTLETDRLLTQGGAMATINLSDPAGGPALTVGTNDSDSTFDGLIQDAAGGPGSILKTGAGTFTLTGANTFTGTTRINDGQVIPGNALALQNATVEINVDDGLDVNGLDVTIGALAGSSDLDLGSATVTTGGNGANTTYAGILTGDSDSILFHNGAGTLTLTGGDDITPSSIGTLRAQSGAILVDGARIDAIIRTLGGGDIALENGADVRMAGSPGLVQDATLFVAGSGTSLTGNRLDAASSGGTGSIVVEQSASLDLTGLLGLLIIGFEGAGDLTVQTGAAASANQIILGIESNASGDALVTGNNSLLSANELFLGGQPIGGAGTLIVEDGATVQVGHARFWTSTSSITIDGGSLETNRLNNFTGVVGTVSISDPTGGTALTVGTNNGNSTFDGLIQDAVGGPGSLSKTGAGTFTLTNANTFSGGVSIDGGMLLTENVSGSATGTGDVQVSVGTLGGNGIVGGAAIVSAGGTVAPGTSVGVLSVDRVDFQSGSTFSIELSGNGGVAGTDFDQLFVAGSATIEPGSTLDLSYLNGFTAAPGDEFVILSAVELSGTFETVNYPDGQNWSIDYDSDAGTITVGLCDDTDTDGVCDEVDICPGFDDNVDTDNDGTPDGCDACAAGASSGDTNADGNVDLEDYTNLSACLAGPGGGLGIGCECFDFDADGDTDLLDYAEFQVSFTAP
jgi:autotransporter-associated beta strand protein/T5SS/PEP-CTERM-associated repeat protein